MDDTWIMAIVVAAVAVLALVAFAAARARNRRHLKERFGPEYDRAVEDADRRRDAERDLSERAKRRDELDIRDLSPAARARYVDEWRAVQARFVDDPTVATRDADALIATVMRERGYPVDDFGTRADMVSTDAPDVVRHYRDAHALCDGHRTGDGSTEDLRRAMVHYRTVFDELIGAPKSVEGVGRVDALDTERTHDRR